MFSNRSNRRSFFSAATLAVATVLAFGGAAAAEEPIKIGFFSPQTGFASSDGTAALHGAQLAVQFLNEQGGLLDEKVELVSYDDASQPAQAANVAQKLTQADDVAAAVSGSYSFLTRPAAAIFQRAKVPMMAAYAVHPEITATGNYIFRTGVPSEVEGASAAVVIGKLEDKDRVALITMDNDAGVALAEAFKRMAPKVGLEIVTEEKYSLKDKDLRPILTRIDGMDVDAIYANGFYAQAAMLVNQAQELGIDTLIVGMEGFDSPKFLDLAKPGAADGVLFTTALDRGSDNPLVQRFLSEYKAQFGVAADMVAASSFDAVATLAEAIRRAGSTDADAIVAALHGIKDFDGVTTGPFAGFTKQGDVIKPVVVQQVKDDEIVPYAVIDDPEIMRLH